MARPLKKASEMTDQELIRKVFPAEVRKEARKVITELNSEKPKRKTVRKVPKKR